MHMTRVHDLAIKHGVSLKNISLDGMANDIELTKQFQPIEDELRTALTFAEDTGTQAGSEAWEAFLAYYDEFRKQAVLRIEQLLYNRVGVGLVQKLKVKIERAAGYDFDAAMNAAIRCEPAATEPELKELRL